jgi:hypothetical protein
VTPDRERELVGLVLALADRVEKQAVLLSRKAERRMATIALPSKSRVPTKAGFYWARWVKAAQSTHEGDQLTPSRNWEVVEVWENFLGDATEVDQSEKWGVSVPGVRESQWVDCFQWDIGPSGRPEPIIEPGCEGKAHRKDDRL